MQLSCTFAWTPDWRPSITRISLRAEPKETPPHELAACAHWQRGHPRHRADRPPRPALASCQQRARETSGGEPGGRGGAAGPLGGPRAARDRWRARGGGHSGNAARGQPRDLAGGSPGAADHPPAAGRSAPPALDCRLGPASRPAAPRISRPPPRRAALLREAGPGRVETAAFRSHRAGGPAAATEPHQRDRGPHPDTRRSHQGGRSCPSLSGVGLVPGRPAPDPQRANRALPSRLPPSGRHAPWLHRIRARDNRPAHWPRRPAPYSPRGTGNRSSCGSCTR